MPSIRGSSQFRSIKGITIYGVTGNTGPQGPRGNDYYGNTGATAFNIITGITLSGYTLISSFSSGLALAASGKLLGITGNTIVMVGGITGSTGTGFVFVGASGNTEITLRKLRGSTGFKSLVGITNDANTITITVDRYDGGYTLSFGELSEIIATNSSGNLVGATLGSAKYGTATDIVRINKTNVFEHVRGANQGGGFVSGDGSVVSGVGSILTVIINTNNEYTDSTNRSKAKTVVLDVSSFRENLVNPIRYNINLSTPPKYQTAFSLFVTGATGDGTFVNTSWGGNIKWPLTKTPCLRTGESYLLHFISGNDVWYGYIFGQGIGSTGKYFCSGDNPSNTTSSQQNSLDYYLGLTGACCLGNNSCNISTQETCIRNSGFFSGVGTTCGTIGSTSVCTESIGACCITNVEDGNQSSYCTDDISPNDCMTLNNDSIESIFSGFDTTCRDVDCSNSFNALGACCDGAGGCKQLTKEDCIIGGGSFSGRGILCYSDNTNPICSSGSGACCTPTGICTQTTAELCLSSGSHYHGNATTCAGITCSSYLKCGGFLGVSVRPGDIIGGGMVVGVYNPKSSKLLGGSHAFSRHGSTADFIYGGETLANYYQSETDYIGYGITGENCDVLLNNDVDSYYVIVSLYPASINAAGKFVNPTETLAETDTFPWYGPGIAWGPMLDLERYTYAEFTYFDKRYDALYLQYGEGYYGITGESLDNIKNVTFQTCYSSRINGIDPVARLFTRSVKASNGLWNRNWGIYNTIRMLSADNAHYIKLSNSPYFTFDEFDSGLTMSAVRALSAFDNNDFTNTHGLTANPTALSDWFIPSHDELAFLAANCITDSTNPYYGFDMNAALLDISGVPLDNWHWSSTGSFDVTTDQGIYTSGKPEHGSVAWAIYFDPNGESLQFTVKKENRSAELKVRPIRLMRCDGKTPPIKSEQYKLWKTPKLLRNSQ
jgi:hypothetical protein